MSIVLNHQSISQIYCMPIHVVETQPKDDWTGWMVLIVDDGAMRVISSAIGMYNLMEHRVNLVEHISKKRAPYRQCAPIYLLTPTDDSVNKLISDWTPSREQRKEPLYADNIFVYFTRHIPDDLFAKMKACKPLARRLKAFGEINIDFVCKEMRNFHFDMNTCLQEVVRNFDSPTPSQHLIAEKMVTVCASLNEYPHIRYRSTSKLCTTLAKLFHHKLKQFISFNKGWWYHGDSSHTEKGRCTLLLLSRADDFLSPLMHEFTYQAMVHDLLDVQDDTIITYHVPESISGTTTKDKDNTNANESMARDVLLNENDELWVELRGKHIADISKTISIRIREVVNSNTGLVMQHRKNTCTIEDTNSLSVTQLTNALKSLPEYREVVSQLAQHLRISHQCFNIFNKQGLMDLSELEQILATGKTEDGKAPKSSELISLVTEQLHQRKDSITKFRLLAIFMISLRGGLKPEDQRKLFTAAMLEPKYIHALTNLDKFGIISITPKHGGKRLSHLISQKLVAGSHNCQHESDSEYASSRYSCELKVILQRMQDGNLSLEDYPSVLPMPDEGTPWNGRKSCSENRRHLGSVRQVTNTKFRSSSRSYSVSDHKIGGKFFGARQIVFIVGGVCYSELRCAQELMDKGGPETLVGSTQFLGPKDFVEGMVTL